MKFPDVLHNKQVKLEKAITGHVKTITIQLDLFTVIQFYLDSENIEMIKQF